jgi:uncharacterized protein YggE
MSRAFLKILFIFPAVSAFAQVDSNSVTVVASRGVNVPPDQAYISVIVSALMSATLDDVLAALPGTGITAANLANVYQEYVYDPQSALRQDWYFALIVPLSKLKDTNTLLGKLQASSAGQKDGFQVSLGGVSLQFSDGALHAARTCAATDLLADAQTQAQKIAAATGRFVGRLLAMSGSTADECSIAAKFSVVGF